MDNITTNLIRAIVLMTKSLQQLYLGDYPSVLGQNMRQTEHSPDFGVNNPTPAITSHYLFFVLLGNYKVIAMHSSARLLQACRITLFTRPNCGLCTQAKEVLQRVAVSRPFKLREINIDAGQAPSPAWRNIYDFDVPVVSQESMCDLLMLQNGRSADVM